MNNNFKKVISVKNKNYIKIYIPSVINVVLLSIGIYTFLLFKGPGGFYRFFLNKNIKCQSFFSELLFIAKIKKLQYLKKKFYFTLFKMYNKLLQTIFHDLIFGYQVILEFRGLHYKIIKFYKTGILIMYGLSHYIFYKFPVNIIIKKLNTKKTKFSLLSHNRQIVLEVSSQLKSLHKKEHYNENGLFFINEIFRRKIGKKSKQNSSIASK